MGSDIDNDIFNFNSSQDYLQIEYQIDLFEIHQNLKFNQQKERKMGKPPRSHRMKPLKPRSAVAKNNLAQDKKPVRPAGPSQKPKIFECDRQFQIKPKSDPLDLSKTPQNGYLDNFSDFRRHFYRVNYEQITSSLKEFSHIEITDIRLARVHESAQNDFMKALNDNALYFPHLVYHGTRLQNIESILRYGFLIPNQAHPTNSEAPIITSVNGQAYGIGIYCSQTANVSLSYLYTTNTLLVCAAIPERNEKGEIQRSHGNVFVLSTVSKIIPLFLVDFKYLNGSGINHPCFSVKNQPQSQHDVLLPPRRQNIFRWSKSQVIRESEVKASHCTGDELEHTKSIENK